MSGTVHEEVSSYTIIFCLFLPEMERQFSDKICRETQNTYFVPYTFVPEIRSVYETLTKMRQKQNTNGAKKVRFPRRSIKTKTHRRIIFNRYAFCLR